MTAHKTITQAQTFLNSRLVYPMSNTLYKEIQLNFKQCFEKNVISFYPHTLIYIHTNINQKHQVEELNSYTIPIWKLTYKIS